MSWIRWFGPFYWWQSDESPQASENRRITELLNAGSGLMAENVSLDGKLLGMQFELKMKQAEINILSQLLTESRHRVNVMDKMLGERNIEVGELRAQYRTDAVPYEILAEHREWIARLTSESEAFQCRNKQQEYLNDQLAAEADFNKRLVIKLQSEVSRLESELFPLTPAASSLPNGESIDDADRNADVPR